jgi:uncharacterized caspase-like protein
MTFSSQARRRLVDKESGYPYTVADAITRTGIAMNQTRIGNRFVVIAGTAPASQNPSYREPTEHRTTPRRTVVIRNGKSVGIRRCR